MEADSLTTPFPRLLDEFLRPAAPDTVLLRVLAAAGDETVRASELRPLIDSDTGYRNYLFAQAFLSTRISDWFEENANSAERDRIALERTLGLLGKAPIRNILACARIERILGTSTDRDLHDDPELKISTQPSTLIPYALEAEKTCQDRLWLSPETAFSAGIHYDWIAAAIKKRAGSAEEKSAVANAFTEGILTAKMAYALGERTKEIKTGKYLFATGLLLPIGKALMICLYPKGKAAASWAEFLADADRAADRRFDYLRFLEPKKFPATHAELSSLFVNFGGVLSSLEKSLCFYQDPEVLNKVNPDDYDLAVLLSLATRMAATKSGGFKIEPFQDRWMKANQITAGALQAAAADALSAKK